MQVNDLRQLAVYYQLHHLEFELDVHSRSFRLVYTFNCARLHLSHGQDSVGILGWRFEWIDDLGLHDPRPTGERVTTIGPHCPLPCPLLPPP